MAGCTVCFRLMESVCSQIRKGVLQGISYTDVALSAHIEGLVGLYNCVDLILRFRAEVPRHAIFCRFQLMVDDMASWPIR